MKELMELQKGFMFFYRKVDRPINQTHIGYLVCIKKTCKK